MCSAPSGFSGLSDLASNIDVSQTTAPQSVGEIPQQTVPEDNDEPEGLIILIVIVVIFMIVLCHCFVWFG